MYKPIYFVNLNNIFYIIKKKSIIKYNNKKINYIIFNIK